MSQSPIDNFSEANVLRYRQGWQALNRLLHENRSFSGDEKHNAYLNCGSGKFADVSAVTGLDFAEDGRAIAAVDWDFDGDLDLWITNRTAPRVRFLANQSQSEGAFISLYLEGNGQGTNRDAIGARVAVQLGEDVLIKSKYAGESFLSQSSRWMHFGLGKTEVPVNVTVNWPGGSAENFSGLSPNQFYVLSQGSGQASPWQKPNGILDFAAGSSEIPVPETDANARIVLAGGLAFPPIFTTAGEPISLGGKAKLVNVWAPWCRPCLEELASWSRAADRLDEAGLEVLLLNAGEDNELSAAEDEASQAKANEVLHKLGVSFPNIALAPESVRSLDIIQRAVLDRWEALPVPCTFLVDAQGFVNAIYKGPVELDVILADAKQLFGADPEVRRQAAVPFPGVWTHDPPLPDPLFVSTQFVDFNLIPAALGYLQHATRLDQELRAHQFTNVNFADRYLVMATLLKEQDMPSEAIQAYESARDLNPSDLRIRLDLGDLLEKQRHLARAIPEWQAALTIKPGDLGVQQRLAMAYLQLNQPEKALPYLEHLVRALPDNARLCYFLGTALQKTGQLAPALAAFEKSAKLDPDLLSASNNIAWIRATHPDPAMRDGANAVHLAKEICAKTGYQNPNLLDTLSVAYAEMGDFDQALKMIDRALAILQKANSADHEKLNEQLRARRALFAEGKAYRDKSL